MDVTMENIKRLMSLIHRNPVALSDGRKWVEVNAIMYKLASGSIDLKTATDEIIDLICL